MAFPLIWPGVYFFYPLGNTSAVSLSRDLAPEEVANILLLGCGDPRSVLYTIFCEPSNATRRLDFTCGDIDPAILARNILLFTMIVDKIPQSIIWNIFFHMRLDETSHNVLVQQCKKIIVVSDTLQSWASSPYGQFLRMATENTLAEARRHWSLYAEMRGLSATRLSNIREAFERKKKEALDKGMHYTAWRSAGPLAINSDVGRVVHDQCKRYWETGVTQSDPSPSPLPNPTFAYSLAGEGCSVHYGTDPLTPFHLTAAVANNKRAVTPSTIIVAAKEQFSQWCAAFLAATASLQAPIVRFFYAEATAMCRALTAFNVNGVTSSGIPVAQWKTQLIRLNDAEYLNGGAPSTFNVVDSSNLVDHIGLLNVLIPAVPLLTESPSSRVLYTESLVYSSQDATKEFTERLYMDITLAGLLLGICPVDHLTGFTTQSNASEMATFGAHKGQPTQFRQVTTWKSAGAGDPSVEDARPLTFESYQLGTFLYDMYHLLFEQEDSPTWWRINKHNMKQALAHCNIIHYIRETFVALLQLIKDRLQASPEQWSEIIHRFIVLTEADITLPMDTVNRHDLYAQLHRRGLFSEPRTYWGRPPATGRFAGWATVPPLMRVILVVPRAKLALFKKLAPEEVGTPLLQCDLRGKQTHNIFASMHVAFGRVVLKGSKEKSWVLCEEDQEGMAGKSPLLVSFVAPTRLLTDLEPQEDISACFSVRNTAGSPLVWSKLGLDLSGTVHSAKILDTSQVYIIAEQPTQQRKLVPPKTPKTAYAIGKSIPINVNLDEECEFVDEVVAKVLVEDELVKDAFTTAGKAMPRITQPSPCVVRLAIGNTIQDVRFPFPVIGSKHRLRLARKSCYIEVIVPLSSPFLKPDGMTINPFPVVSLPNNLLSLWSFHRLDLSRLPALSRKASGLKAWFEPHLGATMSTRELALRKAHTKDPTARLQNSDPLMLVKDTIHTIFVRAAGTQGKKVYKLFCLRDDVTNNCDTVFFVSEIRFDLTAHTVVCDAFVLPLTRAILDKTSRTFSNLLSGGEMSSISVYKGEMSAWKQLVPALAERCRSTWTHLDTCEYMLEGKIPRTETMEADPLCSCGRGKDVEAMQSVALWKPFSQYVTRIALSPLFAVSYLESVGRDLANRRCALCRAKGKPKLLMCTGCNKVRYCSKECAKKDWKTEGGHKSRCSK